MSALSNYDLKQIRLIGKRIDLFKTNKLDLFDLVGDLGGFLNIIESIPNSWKDEFQAETNTLEMIHDSIEDGSISRWSGDFKEDLQKSISKLKILISSIIEEYLERPDPKITESAVEIDSSWLICPKCNDAWESNSSNAMVVCPKCDCVLHNPRVKSE